MTIEVPAQDNEPPRVALPDGTTAVLTADYQETGTMTEDQQWELTVRKVVRGSGTPLAGAEIGLYADENCQTRIKTEASGSDGRIVFSGLIKGQRYWLKEVKAPGGYQLNDSIYEGMEDTPVIIENAPLPEEPGIPVKPGKPDKPDTSDEPEIPDEPETSGEPGSPNEPGTSEEPDIPDGPNTSDELGTSVWPDIPVWPEIPEGPDSSGGLDLSDNSGSFRGPDAPGESGAASSSGGASTGDPNIPQTGDNTGLLAVVTLLAGSVLAAMTLCRVFVRKRRRKSKIQ